MVPTNVREPAPNALEPAALLVRHAAARAAATREDVLNGFRELLPGLALARKRWPRDEPLFRAQFEALDALGEFGAADRAFVEFAATAVPSAWLLATGLRWSRESVQAGYEDWFRQAIVGWRFEPRDLPDLAAIVRVMQYFDFSREELHALYRRYDALMHGAIAHMPRSEAKPMPRRNRLRVGYLSADFRRHVMGDLMLDVMSRHDRQRFDILAYSLLAEASEDATTTRFRKCCNDFVRLADFDDENAARRIAADGIDILVDLASQTPQARPGIFLFKPAPVIVSHLGDHGCAGMTEVDFKLGDPITDLPDVENHQIERSLRMQGCMMPFRRETPALEMPGERERLGLPPRAIVFGAFAATIKLSPRLLALWRRIFAAVPNGVLALSPFTRRELLLATAKFETAVGLPRERITVIQPSGDAAANRARYRQVDIVLDTLPYTGGDSTVAALDMGVPVVTRAGKRQAERMGLSILTHLGVTDTVADSDDDYVDIACRLACDATWRQSLSRRIRARVEASGIADMTLYARRLEEALERAAGTPWDSARSKTRV